MHADWWIGEPEVFRQTADLALRTARAHDRLVTVGMVPTRPETGYGYIVPGAALDADATRVARFQEKPDAATALDLMAAGALWNSGLFAWTAERLAAEVKAHTPELAPWIDLHCEGRRGGVLQGRDAGLDRRRACSSGARRWRWCAAPSAGTTSAPGTRSAASATVTRGGNVTVGPASLHDASDCIVWSDGEPIVVSDVSDLIVVRANGRILVTHRSRAADLKQLLDALPPAIRDLP